jgi:uncharacterized protein YodC (DUF2158 family)
MPHGFEVGQVVRLKSGGPKMTVSGIADYGYAGHDQALCVWFEGIKRQEAVFELLTLERADQDHRPTFAITE